MDCLRNRLIFVAPVIGTAFQKHSVLTSTKTLNVINGIPYQFTCRYIFSMSARIPILERRNRRETATKSGCNFGPGSRQRFRDAPFISAEPSKTTRHFAFPGPPWYTAWCGKSHVLPMGPLSSGTSSAQP
ncbi:hypothetical protein T09_6044 [Trichinella sp. T9]|nr:hypothetical protein T09_6044 [Trichinella sp. T9]